VAEQQSSKREAYEHALATRAAKDKVAPHLSVLQAPKKPQRDEEPEEEEVDPDLAASLERARRLARAKVHIHTNSLDYVIHR
jgi:hypothetical protein